MVYSDKSIYIRKGRIVGDRFIPTQLWVARAKRKSTTIRRQVLLKRPYNPLFDFKLMSYYKHLRLYKPKQLKAMYYRLAY